MTISQARIDAAMRNTPSFSNLEPQDVHDIIEAADNEPEYKAAIDGVVNALEVMINQEVDYMQINKLGDPEEQHAIIQARAAIAALRGET